NSSKFSTIFLTLLLVGMSFVAGSLFTNLRGKQTGSVPTDSAQTGAGSDVKSPTTAPATKLTQLGTTVGNFTVLDQEVCLEEGLPAVYYFGSSGCPHCTWEHPVVTEVMAKFAGVIEFRDRMDSQDDMDVFTEYQEINNGSIPFLVLGCRYVRVGSGERSGEEAEVENLTALICKLTDNQPASVCSSVSDLVSTIN
ncbi:thioredoxin family protein, partial [Patescibacteria group bacterium]|nr:thioredoxin family protein [Patescibacteria group bacterium]